MSGPSTSLTVNPLVRLRVSSHNAAVCSLPVQSSPSASIESLANTRSEAVNSTWLECSRTTADGTSAAARTRYIGSKSTNITDSQSHERNAET